MGFYENLFSSFHKYPTCEPFPLEKRTVWRKRQSAAQGDYKTMQYIPDSISTRSTQENNNIDTVSGMRCYGIEFHKIINVNKFCYLIVNSIQLQSRLTNGLRLLLNYKYPSSCTSIYTRKWVDRESSYVRQ